MTQETTLTIPRCIELVGVWMGQSRFTVPVELTVRSEFEWLCRIGGGYSCLIVVIWDAKGLSSEILSHDRKYSFTEQGLGLALDQLRGHLCEAK